MPKPPKTATRLARASAFYLGRRSPSARQGDLLRLVAETGSLSEAARRMKMSYMKAGSWCRS